MDPHFMPVEIEEPTPILFWSPLEFVVAVSLAGFGIIAGFSTFGMLIAMGVLVGSRKLKRGARRGAAQHFLWAIGLQVDPALRCFPAAWVNDFTE